MASKSKNKFNACIRNQVDSGVLELYFLDVIYDTYDWWTGDTTNMVQEVVSRVKAANPSTIQLIIDSEGGDAGIGLAIYNFLVAYNATKEVEVIGMAGSIASVIAQAASKGKRKIARNGFIVIHKAWGVGIGNADDLRATADVIDKYTDTIVDVYTQTTGKTADEINALIEPGDYWMTGQEAIDMGFADDFLPNNTSFSIAARISSLTSNYKNIPANLIQPEEDDSEEDQPEETTVNNPKKHNMSFQQKMNNFISNFKKQKVDNKAPNLAAEVADQMAEPMEELARGFDEEIQNQLSTAEENVLNKVKETYENKINDLQSVVNSLKEQVENLTQEAADNKGSETKPKNQGDTPVWGAGKSDGSK